MARIAPRPPRANEVARMSYDEKCHCVLRAERGLYWLLAPLVLLIVFVAGLMSRSGVGQTTRLPFFLATLPMTAGALVQRRIAVTEAAVGLTLSEARTHLYPRMPGILPFLAHTAKGLLIIFGVIAFFATVYSILYP